MGVIAAPTYSNTSFTYDGNLKHPDISYDTSAMVMTGDSFAKNPGTYTVEFVPFNIGDEWSDDGTNGARGFQWTIGSGSSSISVDIPTAPETVFAYDGNTKRPNVSGYNPEAMTVRGIQAATDVDSYTITYSLTNTEVYSWSDGTTDDKKIEWSITKASYRVALGRTFAKLLPETDWTDEIQFEAMGTGTIQYAEGNTDAIAMEIVNDGAAMRFRAVDERALGERTTVSLEIPESQNYYGYAFTVTILAPAMIGATDADGGRRGTIPPPPQGSEMKVLLGDGEFHDAYESGVHATIIVVAPDETLEGQTVTLSNGSRSYTGTIEDGEAEVEVQMQGLVIAKAPTSEGGMAVGYVEMEMNGIHILPLITGYETVPVALPEMDFTETVYDETEQTPYTSEDVSEQIVWTGIIAAEEPGTYRVRLNLRKVMEYNLHLPLVYKWEDGTQRQRVQEWSISRIQEEPVLVSDTSFSYNGSQHVLDIPEYDETAMSLYGVTEAMEVGRYLAAFQLLDTKHHEWTDGSVGFKSVDWEVTNMLVSIPVMDGKGFTNEFIDNMDGHDIFDYFDPQLLPDMIGAGSTDGENGLVPKPTAGEEDRVLQGDGLFHSISYPSPGSTVTIWFDGSLFDGAEVRLTDGMKEYIGTIENGSVSIGNVTIQGVAAAYATAEDGTEAVGSVEISYAGLYSAQLFTEFEKVVVDIPDDGEMFRPYTGSRQGPYAVSTEVWYDGFAFMKNPGVYKVTYYLRNVVDTSGEAPIYYEWSDGTVGRRFCQWKIIGNVYTATYDGTFKTPVTNYDSGTIWRTDTYTMVDAGEYTVTFSLKSPDSSVWIDESSEPKSFSWRILRQRIQAGTPSQSVAMTYSTEVQGPTWDTFNWVKMYMGADYSGLSAGTYSIAFTPTENYCWEDGTTSGRNPEWVIAKSTTAIPVLQEEYFDYNGEVKEPKVTAWDPSFVLQTGRPSAANVGTYFITFTLTDPDNVTWDDGTVKGRRYEWSIGVSGIGMEPKGTVQRYTGIPFRFADWFLGEYYDYGASLVEISGDTEATDVGTYTASFTPKYGYEWLDGTSTPRTAEWRIVSGFVEHSKVPGQVLVTTGNVLNPSLPGYDPSLVEVSGTRKSRDGGGFTVKYSLKDPESYVWEDLTSEDKEYSWEVMEPASWPDGTDDEIARMIAAARSGNINLVNHWKLYEEREATLPAVANGGYVGESQPEQTVRLVLQNRSLITNSISYQASSNIYAPPVTVRTLAPSGYFGYVVAMRDSLSKAGYMNPSGTNATFAYSKRYKWLNEMFAEAMKGAFGDVFQRFTFLYQSANPSALGVGWTATISTMFGLAMMGYLDAFQDNDGSLKKRLGDGGTFADWWESSRGASNGGQYMYVSASGEAASTRTAAASAAKGISPFGVI